MSIEIRDAPRPQAPEGWKRLEWRDAEGLRHLYYVPAWIATEIERLKACEREGENWSSVATDLMRLCTWFRVDVLEYGVRVHPTQDWLAARLSEFTYRLAELTKDHAEFLDAVHATAIEATKGGAG